MIDERHVDAILRIPSDFSEVYIDRKFNTINFVWVDSSTATLVKGYIEGSIKAMGSIKYI